MKVCAITPGYHVPSSRFRVRQYIPLLKRNGIEVCEKSAVFSQAIRLPGKLSKVRRRYLFPVYAGDILVKALSRMVDFYEAGQSDLIWLNREMTFGVSVYEGFFRKPFVFDVDDAIWINRDYIKKISKNASMIFAGNEFIADALSGWNDNVRIIPTAIDVDRFSLKQWSNVSDRYLIGWTGSSDNLRYLYDIEIDIKRLMDLYPDIYVGVVSDKPPQFSVIPRERVVYNKWNPGNEVHAIQEFDVGVMPLYDTDWERGKCSFKMLQYMSVGLPVCVSAVGMNVEVASKGFVGLLVDPGVGWFDALEEMYLNRDKYTLCGLEGRAVVDKYYSASVVAEKIAENFRFVL